MEKIFPPQNCCARMAKALGGRHACYRYLLIVGSRGSIFGQARHGSAAVWIIAGGYIQGADAVGVESTYQCG